MKSKNKPSPHIKKNILKEAFSHLVYGNNSVFSWVIPCIIVFIFSVFIVSEWQNDENRNLNENCKLIESYTDHYYNELDQIVRESMTGRYTKANYLMNLYQVLFDSVDTSDLSEFVSQMNMSTEDELLSEMYKSFYILGTTKSQTEAISEDEAVEYISAMMSYQSLQVGFRIGKQTEMAINLIYLTAVLFAVIRIFGAIKRRGKENVRRIY